MMAETNGVLVHLFYPYTFESRVANCNSRVGGTKKVQIHQDSLSLCSPKLFFQLFAFFIFGM